MNTPKHTPGPWMIFPSGDIGSAAVRTPEHTVINAGSVKGDSIQTAMSNAKLIAAAPELLRVAILVSELTEVLGQNNAVVVLAREAIAKANGGSAATGTTEP